MRITINQVLEMRSWWILCVAIVVNEIGFANLPDAGYQAEWLELSVRKIQRYGQFVMPSWRDSLRLYLDRFPVADFRIAQAHHRIGISPTPQN